MDIKFLDLRNFSNGSYQKKYYQKTIKLAIGESSDAYFIVVASSLKVHLTNCSLYESLDTPNSVEDNTAEWKLVATESDDLFTLNEGVSYLYAVNTSIDSEAIMTITGV